MYTTILLLSGFFLFFTGSTNAQSTGRPYYGGKEQLEEYPRHVGENPRLKSAWLPNGQQILFDGNGYREYEMWGEIRRYYYRNGTTNGPVLFMDTSRTRLHKIGYYAGDKTDGTWITFYDDGQLHHTVTYDSGNVVGPMTVYHRNGQLKSRYTVNNALEINGAYTEFHTNGQVKLSGQYEAVLCNALLDSSELAFQQSLGRIRARSVPVGKWTEYYPSGQVKKTFAFDNFCTFTLQTDTVNATSWSSQLLVNECPSGTWTEYDENGQVTAIRRFRDCMEITDSRQPQNTPVRNKKKRT